MKEEAPRKWEMWAHECLDCKNHTQYLHPGPKVWVEMFGLPETVVPVVLTESEVGNYLGWIETGETVPCMVWPSFCFDMCFPSGSKEAVDKGQGSVVRLEITKQSAEVHCG